MPRKKLDHHVKPTKKKQPEWSFVQLRLTDKRLFCQGTHENCSHKVPTLHSYLTGYCGKYNDEQSHSRCPGTVTCLGGKKLVVCCCPCHQGRVDKVEFGAPKESSQPEPVKPPIPSAVKKARAAKKKTRV